MALGAILATQLTDHSARAYSLWVDGLDVLIEPGMGTMTYGTPVDSIAITEMGPDGVSSIVFKIIDMANEVGLAEGQVIRMWDHTLDIPLFYGFVQTWSYEPLPVGRVATVRGIGIDALLDWMIVPNLTIVAGTDEVAAIQVAYAAATGVGASLNTATDSGPYGHQATPIAGIGDDVLQYDVVLDGDTLRSALSQINAAVFFADNPYTIRYAMVDMYGGLRSWAGAGPVLASPVDYHVISIDLDQPIGAGKETVTLLDHETDAGGASHQVYVLGANAAGSGLVTDGTGTIGPVASLNDTKSDSAPKKLAIGGHYLGTVQGVTRGRFRMEQYTMRTGIADGEVSQQRAGCELNIDCVYLGLSFGNPTFRVFSIDKTFNNDGTQNWDVAYGGHKKSAIRTARRLTRGTLS